MTEPLSLSQLAARKEARREKLVTYPAKGRHRNSHDCVEAEDDIDALLQIIANLVAAGEVLSNGARKESWKAWRTLLKELGEK